MVLKNGTVLTEDFQFVRTDLVIEDGIIVSVGETDAPGRDLNGSYVLPGLVDIHTHGCVGGDHLDGNPEITAAMRAYMKSRGTTSLLAAIQTYDTDQMLAAANNAVVNGEGGDGAHIRGIYLEGPFFCDKFKGGQHPSYLRNPDPALFEKVQAGCGGQVKIVSIAPELDGGIEFIRSVRDAKVFIGHTDCDYDTACVAIEAGAAGLTHTFNAMRGLHHRNPNALGAALIDDRMLCECICDGVHIHPAMVKLLYRQVGRERFIIISDSVCAAGLPDGEYVCGGRPLYVRNGTGYLEDGTISGSSTDLLQEVRNLVNWGVVSLSDAVYAASALPAKAAGIYDRVGSISVGKAADLLILSANLELQEVLIGAK
ncbi:MAG: N-acetylglucosamine-6-phosphate deacetylase [Oscillospiraceae bacterium]|nr:N-acetylglucosamine-6-phosphate deacetylase [Oscillospiraceae bacterium]